MPRSDGRDPGREADSVQLTPNGSTMPQPPPSEGLRPGAARAERAADAVPAIGLVLFAAYALVPRGATDVNAPKQIVLTLDELQQLQMLFQSQWRRQPTPQEFEPRRDQDQRRNPVPRSARPRPRQRRQNRQAPDGAEDGVRRRRRGRSARTGTAESKRVVRCELREVRVAGPRSASASSIFRPTSAAPQRGTTHWRCCSSFRQADRLRRRRRPSATRRCCRTTTVIDASDSLRRFRAGIRAGALFAADTGRVAGTDRIRLRLAPGVRRLDDPGPCARLRGGRAGREDRVARTSRMRSRGRRRYDAMRAKYAAMRLAKAPPDRRRRAMTQ